MAGYGTSVEALAKILAGHFPASDDPSQDVILHLAAAYAAAQRLEKAGADLMFKGQPLVLQAVERAYREALFVRSKRTPVEIIRTEIISRFGRPMR